MSRATSFLGKVLTVLGATLVLAACGGGGGGTASSADTRNITSMGVITGFGSVIVNGTHFDSSGADIIIHDRHNRPESELKIGMVVKIKGSKGNDGRGKANSIEVEEVEGPMDDINATGTSLVVAGQTVLVNANTKFEDVAGSAALATALASNKDLMVEVSGFLDSAGNIVATLIELEQETFVPGATVVEILGIAKNPTNTANSFRLGNLIVSFTGFVPDGAIVEVEGTLNAARTVLTASEVEIEAQFAEGEEVEVEGLISGCVKPCSTFHVNGTTVQINGATRFKDGTAADLVDRVMVEVEGVISGSVLMANEVEFRQNRRGM